MKRRTMKRIYAMWALVLISTTGCSNQKAVQAEKKPSKKETVTEDSTTKGMEIVRLTKEKLANADLAAVVVRKGVFPNIIEVVGQIAHNDRRRVELVARSAGRIEEIHAFLGDQVKAGQWLASLYSPDYLSAQTDLLQAADRIKGENNPEALGVSKSLVKAAEQKLMLLGEPKTEIQKLLDSRTPNSLLHVHAPFSGTVVSSEAVVGRNLEQGGKLMTVSDLSRVWALLDIYEKDLSTVAVGSKVRVVADAFPNTTFAGSIIVLGGEVEEKARTVQARAELDNSKLLLKPGMFARAQIESKQKESRDTLLIPTISLVKMSAEEKVFVQTSEGVFEARDVTIGRRSSSWIEILSGLAEGERVVTQGAFILKSELSKSEMGEGD